MIVNGFKVITLCGSTKFKEHFIQAQERLTLEGNLVISVGLFGHTDHPEIFDTDIKIMLDKMHKAKIDLAEEIFVIDVNHYIGESTKSEIEYAQALGKPVRYLSDWQEAHANDTMEQKDITQLRLLIESTTFESGETNDTYRYFDQLVAKYGAAPVLKTLKTVVEAPDCDDQFRFGVINCIDWSLAHGDHQTLVTDLVLSCLPSTDTEVLDAAITTLEDLTDSRIIPALENLDLEGQPSWLKEFRDEVVEDLKEDQASQKASEEKPKMTFKTIMQQIKSKKLTNGRRVEKITVQDEFHEILETWTSEDQWKVDLYADCPVTDCRCRTKDPTKELVEVLIEIIKPRN